MPSGIIAQNNTFENLFGLESIANYNEEESLLMYEKETETPLEIEDLAEEKTLTPIEKKDGRKNLTKILSDITPVFTVKDLSKKEKDLSFVQTISGKMADEKNGKYVRYGKSLSLSMGVTIVS